MQSFDEIGVLGNPPICFVYPTSIIISIINIVAGLGNKGAECQYMIINCLESIHINAGRAGQDQGGPFQQHYATSLS